MATADPPLRADARRNRDRILAATRAAFVELGIEVPVVEIARRAEVGMGTLYRHFPTKAALIDAVVDARFAELTHGAEQALAAPGAWDGLRSFLLFAVGLQASDRGFNAALAARGRDQQSVRAARRQLHEAITRLVARGHEERVLRPDVRAEDVVVLLWATARVVERTIDSDPAQARRFAALHLAGLAAGAGEDTAGVAALTPAQLLGEAPEPA
jgi:AcrR family transcriptional regulator